MATAAFDHRGELSTAMILQPSQYCGARTAWLRQASSRDRKPGIRLNETFSQHADHRNDIGIAGNRALDHIREDFSNPFIKGPVAEAGNRRGKSVSR
jgi:hypothetical protein